MKIFKDNILIFTVSLAVIIAVGFLIFTTPIKMFKPSYVLPSYTIFTCLVD